MKQVQIEYVAMLRERAGVREERVTTAVNTAAELYDEIAVRHNWSFPRTALRVAINESLSDWSDPVRENDRILFLPPSSGG